MDLVGLVGELRRRWRLVLPLLVLAAACAVGTFLASPTTYDAHGSLVLLATTTDAKDRSVTAQAAANPYLSFSSSLVVTGYVLARTETADERVHAVARAAHSSAPYTVGPDPNATGPILLITVTGTDKAQVARTLKTVSEDLPRTLDALQSATQAPTNARISARVVTIDPEPKPVLKGKIVKTGLAAALVLTLSFLASAMVGRERQRRRAPRGRGAEARTWQAAGEQLVPDDFCPPVAENGAPVLAPHSS